MAQRPLSIFGIVLSSLAFLRNHATAILARVWFPALLGCLAFYVSILVYLWELRAFMAAPSRAHASFALAVSCLAVLLLLFLYAVVLSAVLKLRLGRESGPHMLQLDHQVYRLYAALLRFVLLMGVLLVFGILAGNFFHDFLPDLEGFADFGIMLGLVFLAIRVGFLLPAVAIVTPDGVVLRRSWALSRGRMWQFLLLALILTLPGLALEFAGEYLGRLAHVFPAANGEATLKAYMDLLDHIVPPFAILVSLSMTLTITLEGLASAAAYDALAAEAG